MKNKIVKDTLALTVITLVSGLLLGLVNDITARSSKPVTAVQRVGSSENLRKTALQGGFFVYRTRDYDDRQRISRRS